MKTAKSLEATVQLAEVWGDHWRTVEELMKKKGFATIDRGSVAEGGYFSSPAVRSLVKQEMDFPGAAGPDISIRS